MPFKWLESFGITDPVEIENIRQRIIERVKEEEARLDLERKIQISKSVEGYDVTDKYKPKTKERRIFVIATDKDSRINFINVFKEFSNICRECYELMKKGVEKIPWPIECFVPRCPKLVNPIPD